RPAAIRRTIEKLTCATSRVFFKGKRRLDDSPAAKEPEDFILDERSRRVACRDGKSPKRAEVNRVTSAVKARTRASGWRLSWMAAGPLATPPTTRRRRVSAQNASTMPTPAPTIANV